MIAVTATLRQAVTAAASREAAFSTPAFRYLPGWVLRGGLAAAWIRRHGLPRDSGRYDEFVSLFEGGVRFGPVLPRGASFEPLSVKGCKYRPRPDCAATAIDATIDQPGEGGADACPACQGRLEPLKGRLVGSVTINRTRAELTAAATAADGKLFRREELAKEQKPGEATELSGTIDADALDDSRRTALTELSQGPVWFGGKRSTNGRAQVVFGDQAVLAPTARADGRLVIRCSSPMIAIDDATRPLLAPDTAEIERALGVAGGSVREVGHWTRPERVGGWHAASGLPKPSEIAIAAGSTFVYECDSSSADGLARLASTGLGMRTREGFGWIEVNPPPWSPPGVAAVAGESEAEPPVGEATSDQLEDFVAALDKNRSWAAEMLRHRAMQLETGRDEQIHLGRRVRRLREEAQAPLRRLVESGDLRELQLVLAMVEAAQATDDEPGGWS